MKFELKTEKENSSKSFIYFLGIVFILTLIVILCDIALKLGNISKKYEIDFKCRILSVEKSKTNFNKLSNISNLKSKQRIWEFCKEVVK